MSMVDERTDRRLMSMVDGENKLNVGVNNRQENRLSVRDNGRWLEQIRCWCQWSTGEQIEC